MGFEERKFNEADFANQDVSSLPDRPSDAGITAQELKARFDNIAKMVIALGKVNGLIDDLGADSAAEKLGFSLNGMEAGTIKEAIEWLKKNNLERNIYDSKGIHQDIFDYADSIVKDWAKAETKPSYTAQEVGALPNTTPIPEVPKDISAFNNDAGYITQETETDPTVPDFVKSITAADIARWNAGGGGSGGGGDMLAAVYDPKGIGTDIFSYADNVVKDWAKAETKPSYTAQEVGALSKDTVIPVIPENVSAFTNDTGYITEEMADTNYAGKTHTHTAQEIGAAPSYTYGTDDMTAGTSELETGKLHLVYE